MLKTYIILLMVYVEFSDICSKMSLLVDGVYHSLTLTDLWHYVHRGTSLNMQKYDLHKFSHTSS